MELCKGIDPDQVSNVGDLPGDSVVRSLGPVVSKYTVVVVVVCLPRPMEGMG